ncbi:ferredoxin [Micromonospora sp. PLK6-60]|uniref:ferredoxin n=1 Tax=Micromonospora sp. PLK6-60 TaxID=2873383 RepID=UPI001CA61E49|nr:ferredoxin [Micromonospora sp. PLK6-60]MBY8875061.1 ferredoxin [Micromonospora sp. PLK6-60]
MKIDLDPTRCVGAGQCVLTAPEVFDQGDPDGVVVLRDPDPADELTEDVLAAADLCPVGAILVADGGDDR